MERSGVRRVVVALALLGGTLALVTVRADDPPAYKNPRLSVEARVSDLLARMTLEEKVAQLGSIWGQKAEVQDEKGIFDPAKAKKLLGNGIGEVSRPSEVRQSGGPWRTAREAATYVNAVQKFLIEETRLGIPALFHEEAVHGFAALGATIFPVPIGLASTWDPAQLEKVMTVAAREARARGVQQVLAPVIDLARDPRWGRTEETYGEDTYLVTRLGVSAIRGYQGTTLPLADGKVFATAKHFAVHGPHEGGINTAPANISERVIREQYLPPFEAAVKEAHVYAVMPSYNEIDGLPSTKNRWLLDTVLRQEWHFGGLVTSDYYAVDQLRTQHMVAADAAEAARVALRAGVDVELPDTQTYATLPQQVKDGRVSLAAIDTAVTRVLRAKFLAGVFEKPYADPAEAERVSNAPDHQKVALETAQRSIILLKNDKGLLPLDRKKIKTLAVIGPNAKGVHLGGYAVDPGRGIDILTGIRDKVGKDLKVTYAEGCRITENESSYLTWYKDDVVLGDPVKNRQRIKEAVPVAQAADAVVLVLGGNESTSREAWADNHLGDTADLDLLGQQDELVDAVVKTGKPVVVLLLNGRPHSIAHVAASVSAILEGWYLGQEGGTAAADVLFGDVNPGGKLPITIPRSVGQLPVYYARKPTSFRGYLGSSREPLFVFGHGLSYTTFDIGNLRIEPAEIGPAGMATVKVDVTNTGRRAGDEVVQLYIRDVVSTVTRPVKELHGFERVGLDPGQKKTVTFTLGPDALSLLDERMNRVVEPGAFDVMVGSSSANLPAKGTLQVIAR
jgi:beta-glucosidase